MYFYEEARNQHNQANSFDVVSNIRQGQAHWFLSILKLRINITCVIHNQGYIVLEYIYIYIYICQVLTEE